MHFPYLEEARDENMVAGSVQPLGVGVGFLKPLLLLRDQASSLSSTPSGVVSTSILSGGGLMYTSLGVGK